MKDPKGVGFSFPPSPLSLNICHQTGEIIYTLNRQKQKPKGKAIGTKEEHEMD